MSDVEATKFYIRHRDGYPDSEAQSYALSGFNQLGVETRPFHGFGDVKDIRDLGPTVGVAGFIGDVHEALRTAGRSIPPNVDYPEQLHGFLGREISVGTLDDVRRRPGRPVFIKPVEHKAFSGFVWDGGPSSRMRIVTQGDEVPVFICDLVEFVSEYRSFILRDMVVDCRRYKGDWSVAPDRRVVEAGVEAMGSSAPRAYCLDWGVTADGRTLLVEMNEGFSFGHYGLHPVTYARMLSSRWFEMAGDR